MSDLPRNRTRSATLLATPRTRPTSVNASPVAVGGAQTESRALAQLSDDDRKVLVAAMQSLGGTSRESYALNYRSWQDELWEYSRSVGEYGAVMDWYASGISRHHLVAAVQRTDDLLREPEPITEGPAAELVADLVSNARGGETQYLFKWGQQLGIPGVGFFVGEDRVRHGGRRVYDVKSAKQVRRSTKPIYGEDGRVMRTPEGEVLTGFEVLDEPNRWRPLGPSSLVGRIFRPDGEYDYDATSWSRHALTTLREIDLYNRHIVATLLSRLVFNGILFIPEEVTFPVNPQFQDAPDPFIAELIAIASRGIKDPGSPASAIPLPLRVPSQFIDKFHHMIIATGVDSKVIQARSAAVQRLATQLPAPPEALTGKSQLNYWNGYLDTADNVRYYFGPTMEILVGGFTELFLWPMLTAAGADIYTPDGRGRYVVWHDATDLVSAPDNSQNAQAARGINVISDASYRKITGMDDADAPTDDELKSQVLTDLATKGLPIPDSFYKRFPSEKPPANAPQPPVPGQLPPGQAVDASAGAPGPSPADASAVDTVTEPEQPKNGASSSPGGG